MITYGLYIAYNGNDIILEQKYMTINVNDNVALELKKTSKDKYIFESSDSSIATVDENGVVTAKRTGQVIITIRLGKKKETCLIVIIDEPGNNNVIYPDKITLKKSTLTLKINESYTLNYVVSPDNVTDLSMKWSSSNNKVVSVENGIIKALKAGTSTITLTSSNGKKAECKVTVVDSILPTIEVTNVKFTESNIELTVGASKKLSYEITPTNANDQSVTIKSSDNKVVSVENGIVKALKAGTSTITLTSSNGKKTTCIVTVIENHIVPTKVTIQAVNNGLKLGSTLSLNYTFEPSNAENSLIKFTSSNASVAMVDDNGKVTAKNLGEAIISAVLNNKPLSSVKIKVIPDLDYIKLDKLRIKEKVKDIKFINPHNSEVIAMQDFDIVNLGKSNETYYFATTYDSLLHNTLKPQKDQVKQLKTGIIYKLTKSQLKDTTKGNIMYVEDAGQCQWIVKEPTGNYFWTSSHSGLVCSGDACVYDKVSGYSCTNKDKCTWWGGNNTNVKRINFARNSYGDSSNGLEYDYGNLGGNKRITVFMAYDSANDLMAVFTKITSKVDVKVYKASDYINGRETKLYSFTIPYNDNMPSASVQGYAISGGYVYRFRGIYTTGIYIEVIDMYGNIILTHKVDPGYKKLRQEAQGIKVYNNKLYFGLNYLSKCTFDETINDCKPGTAGENLHGIFYYE